MNRTAASSVADRRCFVSFVRTCNRNREVSKPIQAFFCVSRVGNSESFLMRTAAQTHQLFSTLQLDLVMVEGGHI